MRILTAMVALAAVVTIGHPASAQSNVIVAANTPRAVDTTKTVLEVHNQRFDDAVIYVVFAGQSQELGMAHGMSKTKFTIPRSLTRGRASLRFIARPFGGRDALSSRDVDVSPGDKIEMTILIA